VAVKDGLVYATELLGFLHCIDLETGELLWKDDLFAGIWSSPLVVGDKVIVTDEDGTISVYRHGRQLHKVGESNLGDAIYSSPSVDEFRLYIPVRDRLLGIRLH
jgi:outer membrane protein assembly factor BamB